MWSEYLRRIWRSVSALQQVVFALAQMQDDVGAAGFADDRVDAVVALAGALPADTVLGGRAGLAGDQRDVIGHDERRIEADAELADEVGVLCLVAGQLLEKLAGARLGDGPDVGDDIVARHADAVVGDGDRSGLRVDGDANPEIGVVPRSAQSVMASKRRRSQASEAFDTSSRRKISLLPYKE